MEMGEEREISVDKRLSIYVHPLNHAIRSPRDPLSTLGATLTRSSNFGKM